jgi:enoyl-CoA hydratase/carnithine racemase
MRVVDQSEDFPSLVLDQADQVLTIRMRGPEHLTPEDRARNADIHWELGDIFSRLRGDGSVRVIVLTGFEDGIFLRPARTALYDSPERLARQNDPARNFKVFTGVVRYHEAVTGMEKPVIAKVNGDAIGIGQSVMFACDLIVSREDAKVRDNHMELGESGFGSPVGVVPGDGGVALVPSLMSPALAKEYLMLCKEFTGRQLADMGIINYAVPLAELDAATDRLVKGCLSRSAYALAWTKRLTNRVFITQMQMGLDASAGYELVNFNQAERAGWKQPTTLE